MDSDECVCVYACERKYTQKNSGVLRMLVILLCHVVNTESDSSKFDVSLFAIKIFKFRFARMCNFLLLEGQNARYKRESDRS